MPEPHGELEIVRGYETSGATAQSGGAIRLSGIDSVLTSATKIWIGKVSNEPGYRSVAPPFFPHFEANRSEQNELVWVTARTPDNIVVNLED